MKTDSRPRFDFVRARDQDSPQSVHHPVIVVGAGPVGLTAAIDLALHGVPSVLLEQGNTVSPGSRAMCYAKRTLEIFDRIGCGDAVVAKGVGWNVGKVFFKDHLVYSFNLLSEAGHQRPAFINLQQYHVEEILIRRARETGRIDLRWQNKVVRVQQGGQHVQVAVDTPQGVYEMNCDWLIVCDGASSPVRDLLGLELGGQTLCDRLLIADVRMKADYPAERWFWFDPLFHPDRSALLHREADDLWRIDFQLGRDADPEEEKRPEKVLARLRAMLGERDFRLEWVSVYTFSYGRMEQFRCGRILFAGDAAHQLSPFGARGANAGIQDADNLAWKLKLVLEGKAPQTLLDSYSGERLFAADENLRNSIRSSDFIVPKNHVSRTFRDAALLLAQTHPFARRLVNSGRLSIPAVLVNSALNTPDADLFAGSMVPGAPATDAPVAVNGELRWLLQCTGGSFNGLYFAEAMSELPSEVASGIAALTLDRIAVDTRVVVEPGNPIELPPGVMKFEDYEDFLIQRFDASPGTFYLLRPDQHVCARWREFNVEWVRRAVLRATCGH